MTAHAMKGDREKCFDVGMDDYIAKPFNQHELLNIIELWIGKKSEMPMTDTKKSNLIEVTTYLKSLSEDIGFEPLSELCGIFKKSFMVKADKIQKGLKDKDTKAILFESHQLISSSASLGAFDISQLARELEEVIKTSDFERANTILKQMITEYKDHMVVLNDFLAKNKSEENVS